MFLGTVGSFLGAKMLPGTILGFLGASDLTCIPVCRKLSGRKTWLWYLDYTQRLFIISKIICRIDEVRILSCYDSTHYNDLSQNYANVMRLEIYYQLECRSAFVLEKALKWPIYPPTEPKSAKKFEIEAF